MLLVSGELRRSIAGPSPVSDVQSPGLAVERRNLDECDYNGTAMSMPSTLSARRSSALVLLALVFAGCDAFYGVNGRVTSCADQRPLQGALLHLETHGKRGDEVSKQDGSYDVLLNDPPGDAPSQLTVAKPGFRTLVREVPNSHVAQDFCLQPEPSADGR